MTSATIAAAARGDQAERQQWRVPRVVRSLRVDWTAARRHAVPGAGARAMLVAAAAGGGVALALALLPTIHAYGGAG